MDHLTGFDVPMHHAHRHAVRIRRQARSATAAASMHALTFSNAKEVSAARSLLRTIAYMHVRGIANTGSVVQRSRYEPWKKTTYRRLRALGLRALGTLGVTISLQIKACTWHAVLRA
jgi:hypothetical protein